MSPAIRTAAATVTWGALGALIPVVLGLGVLLWQGGALADIPPRNAEAISDHEVRIRTLEADRAALIELQTDVRWIRATLEQQARAKR